MATAPFNPSTFRPPSSSPAKAVSSFSKPSVDFLRGSWHVTHSTLPMWKTNRNVKITYTPLDTPPGAIDDLVEYQPLASDKWKTVNGIDKPHPQVDTAYNWRGKGWLKIASSHWEVLGYGDEDGGWVVTFFEKTLFTPAGIDIYARRKGGLSSELVERIRAEMMKINDPAFQKQADQIFEIKHDW
ncbi:hypothetical protein H2198_003458 [Neophaeococcomyces mojaviensis]|uniref:Uncharacterized protein n=1 Tax=Neophaeococcomyces mojaviensis TaxID=3383035 RepID=A0ACC3ABB3_9EURO|nr:hypothetical protein H2198_003458 [Knufia sp. JES_112]